MLKFDDSIKPLIHSLNTAIFQCDPTMDGKITFINLAGAKMLGYSNPEDVIGTLLCDYFEKPEEYKIWYDSHDDDNDTPSDFETFFKQSDGRVHLVEIAGSLVKDVEDKKVRIDGTIRDVHSSKRGEVIKDVISNINEILLSNLDMRKVYHLICDELRKIIEWDRVAIALVEKNGDAIINFAITKVDPKESGKLAKKMSEEQHYVLRGSILETIVQTGKPYIVKDTIKSAMKTDKIYAASGLRSRLGYPLKYKGKIIGSINFGCTKVDYYGDEHISLLEKIAPSLAFGVGNTEKLDERIEDEIISNINKTLISNINMKDIDHIICDELGKIIKWDRVSITSLVSNGDVVVNFMLTHDKGKKGALQKTMSEKTRYPLIGSILEKVITTGKPFVVKDTEKNVTDTDKLYAKEGIRSRLAYPLECKNKVIGSINFGFSQVDYYRKDHIKLLEKIAPSLAFRIENAKLYERATKAEKEFKDLSQTFDSPWS
ncbi:MAG: GAF domain-containing protein [Candidatus Anammoxibacter sp.]